jgi:hypothetical protein
MEWEGDKNKRERRFFTAQQQRTSRMRINGVSAGEYNGGESVEHNSIPHFSAIGNEEERDSRYPLLISKEREGDGNKLLSSKELAEWELMGRTPAMMIVKSVEDDGVPHYLAVGNGEERDRHSPLLSSREQWNENWQGKCQRRR